MESFDKPLKVIKHHSDHEIYDLEYGEYFIDPFGIVWVKRDTYQQVDLQTTAMVLATYAARMKRARDAADVNLKPDSYGDF